MLFLPAPLAMTTAAVGERRLRDLGVSNTGHDLPSFSHFFTYFLQLQVEGKGGPFSVGALCSGSAHLKQIDYQLVFRQCFSGH